MLLYTPDEISGILGIDVREVLFKNKKANAYLWRLVTKLRDDPIAVVPWNLFKRLIFSKQRWLPTESAAVELDQYLRDVSSASGLVEGRLSWKSAIESLNAGIVRSAGLPLAAFESEVDRLERGADEIEQLIDANDLRDVEKAIARVGLPYWPCLQETILKLNRRNDISAFGAVVPLLRVTTTLYLLSLFRHEFFEGKAESMLVLLPATNGERPVRAMARWHDWYKATFPEYPLWQMLYGAAGKDSGAPLVRAWRRGDVVPSWDHVGVISRSLAHELNVDAQEIHIPFRISLMVVRLLDHLLGECISVREKYVPEFDPISPFRDFPLMLEHARKVKAGLAAHSSDEPQPSF